MAIRTAFCRIVNGPGSDEGNYYLLTRITEKKMIPHSFDLVIFHSHLQWAVSIDHECLVGMAAAANMNVNEFSQIAARAFRRDVDASRFHYQVTMKQPEAKTIEFVWMEDDTNSDVKFILGKVELKLESKAQSVGANLMELFNHNCNDQANSSKRIDSLVEENTRLADDRTTVIQKLDDVVAGKQAFEADMFARFVVVLNSKKRKIAQIIREVESSNSRGHNSAAVGTKDEETESDRDTDEEERISAALRNQRKTLTGGSKPDEAKGSLTGEVSSIHDLSLDFGESDKEDQSADEFIPKRRRKVVLRSDNSGSASTGPSNSSRNPAVTARRTAGSLRKSANSSGLLKDVE